MFKPGNLSSRANCMSAINWSNLGFDIIKPRSHIEYVYTDGVWDKGALVSSTDITLNMWATALHYGQSCFEGLKAFRMKDGKIRVFRPNLNAARMQLSCHALSMAAPPTDLFLEAINRVIQDNLDLVPPYGHSGSLYIRPYVIGSGANIAPSPPKEFKFIVQVNPVGDYYANGFNHPVKTIVQYGFDRAAPNGTGHIKAGGNYAPCMGPTAQAKKDGYTLNLFMDAKTRQYIEEFATSNFVALTKADACGKRTYVTPRSTSILGSITNRSLSEIAVKIFGWSVERRNISWEQLKQGDFDEVAACGTAVVITPIGIIDREVPINTVEHEAEIKRCSNETELDALWDDTSKTVALQIESIKIDSDFSGFGSMLKVYRQIQSGDYDGWEKLGWMLPESGL
ncbi:hypothetical protein O5D80_004119 [Batrachochytrium dendrobatidis]|nr:hypothetical protein O5D80_004119 [Batrachochytrium dendrobatidis]